MKMSNFHIIKKNLRKEGQLSTHNFVRVILKKLFPKIQKKINV